MDAEAPAGASLPERARLTADQALWLACQARAARAPSPALGVERLLVYLEMFPTGVYNRQVAERIEQLLDRVSDRGGLRGLLRARLRELRDPHLPPLQHDPGDDALDRLRRR